MRAFFDRPPRPFFIILAIGALILPITLTPVGDFDVWWHLKTGEMILRLKTIPSVDIFSFTAFGAPWINHEWLAELIMWLFYANGGFSLLILWKCLLGLVIFFCVSRSTLLLTNSHIITLWGAVILLFGVADRILDRPFLWGNALLAIFCLCLHRFVSGRQRSLWVLPLLQVLWINIHGGGILGPLLILSFAFGEYLQIRLRGQSPLSKERMRHLWNLGLICVIACAVTPYFGSSLIFPLDHLKMEMILHYTGEWLNPLDSRLDQITTVAAFRVFLPLVLLSFIIGRRKVRLSHLAAVALVGILATISRRFTFEFFIVAIPLFLYNIRNNVAVTDERAIKEWRHLFAMIFIAALLFRFGFPLTLTGEKWLEMGWDIGKEFDFSDTITFLNKEEVHGPVFNEMGVGGALISGRWPRDRVFIDGRTPVYGDQFYANYMAAFNTSRQFEAFDQRYHFDHLVFMTSHAWDFRYVHLYLANHQNWRLIWFSPSSLIYVRNIPKYQTLINRNHIADHPVVKEMKRQKTPAEF